MSSSKITVAEFEAMLVDESALEARRTFCDKASRTIDACGRVLWAFGWAADMPEREGLAIACQAAGELSVAAVDLYRQERWYAGAALVRQFIECEYLVYLFKSDRAQAVNWRKSTRDERLKFFTPAKMRKLSYGKFRSEEYKIHCERGGHPSPEGVSLFAEHKESLLGKNQYLWWDLAQHLDRFWHSFVPTVDSLDLGDIAIIQNARGEFPLWQAQWKEKDPLVLVTLSQIHVP